MEILPRWPYLVRVPAEVVLVFTSCHRSHRVSIQSSLVLLLISNLTTCKAHRRIVNIVGYSYIFWDTSKLASTYLILFYRSVHVLYTEKKLYRYCCLHCTSHRQLDHLETAPSFTFPCGGREARFTLFPPGIEPRAVGQYVGIWLVDNYKTLSDIYTAFTRTVAWSTNF